MSDSSSSSTVPSKKADVLKGLSIVVPIHVDYKTYKFQKGDRVILGGKESGLVMFAGETKFASGEWVGVSLDHPLGRNNGSVNGVQYFECRPLHGIFAPPSKLVLEPQILKVGDTAVAGADMRGKVEYIGETSFGAGVWVGLHLEKPNGKNDGSVQGKKYFQCPMKYGLFAPPSRVSKVLDAPLQAATTAAAPPAITAAGSVPATPRRSARPRIAGRIQVHLQSDGTGKDPQAAPATASQQVLQARQRKDTLKEDKGVEETHHPIQLQAKVLYELQQELSQLKHTLQKVQEENVALAKANAAGVRHNAEEEHHGKHRERELQSSVSSLSAQLKTLTQRHDALQHTYQALKGEYDVTHKEKTKLAEKYKEVSGAMARPETPSNITSEADAAKVRTLQKQVERETTRANKLEAELADARALLREHQDKSGAKSPVIQHKQPEKPDHHPDDVARIEALSKELEESKAEVERLKASLDAEVLTSTEEKKAMAELQAQVDQLTVDINAIAEERDQFHAEAEECRAELERAANETNTLRELLAAQADAALEAAAAEGEVICTNCGEPGHTAEECEDSASF